MTKLLKYQSFVWFSLGLLLGALCFLLLYFFSSGKLSLKKNSRIIAHHHTYNINRLKNDCPQLTTIDPDKEINIFCKIETNEEDRGVTYKVRSVIRVTKDPSNENQVIISVQNKIKDETEHVTEAGYNYCFDCAENSTVDLSGDGDPTSKSTDVQNQILNILSMEKSQIEDAVDDAYHTYKKKEELKEKIANCEVSERSTPSYEREIKPEELIECRQKQLEDITDPVARTRYFHSKVKRDLWAVTKSEDILKGDFLLSDYIRDLNSSSLFTHDYFSVRSSLDMIEKYSDLRRHIDDLNGPHQSIALNNIKANLPLYFYSDENTDSGRSDRIHLESAWNKNFRGNPFPNYYSISRSSSNNSRRRRGSTNRTGISAAEFRNIVNSDSFKNLGL